MVCFTHRSIYEFLSTEAQKERMGSLLGDFIAIDAYTSLRLAEMSANPSIFRLWQSPGVLDLVNLRTISKVDSPPYTYLEALSAVAKNARAILDPPPSVFDSLASHVATSCPSANPITHRRNRFWYKVAYCNTAQRLRAAGGESPQHPIYQALISGNYEYVKWKLRQYPQTDPEISLQLLLCCVVANRAARETWEGSLDIVHILIKRGLSPQVLTDIGHLAVEVSEKRDDPRSRKEGAMLTVWHHLLLACCERPWRDQTNYLPRLGRILEIYLDNGADPVFEFSLIGNGEGDWGVRLPKPANEEPDEARPNVPASEKAPLNNLSHSDKDKYGERGLYMKLTVGVERREFLLTYIGEESSRHRVRGHYPRKVLSLPEFIKLHKFPNEKRLLQLVERNMIMLKDGDGAVDELLLSGGTEASGERISSSSGAPGVASSAKTSESELVYYGATVFSRHSSPTNALPTQWLVLSCVMAIMVAIVVAGVRK